MDSVSGSIMEGVGNEVLVTAVLSILSAVILIAWYSTNITVTQSRLPSVRVDRHVVGLTLNRLPGSSTTQPNPSSPTASSTTDDSEATDAVVVGAQIASLSNVILPDPNSAVAIGVISDVTNEAHAASLAHEYIALPTNVARVEARDGQTTPESSAQPVEDVGAESSVDDQVESPPTELQPSTSDTEEDLPQQAANSEGQSGTGDMQEQSGGNTPSTPLNGNSEEPQPRDDQTIKVRLKFLDGEDRLVTAKKDDTIESFKRSHFAAEMHSNKLVRLIFNGQVLQDSQTLESCHISDNTAIHALITETAAHSMQRTPQTDIAVFNAGVLMVPLFSIILGLLWYLRYEFDELFNVTSTFSLTAITVVFVFCVVAQRHSHRGPVNRRRNYGVNINGNNVN